MRVGLWEAELRASQQAGGMKTLVVEWLTCCSKLPELNREGGEQTKKGLAGRKCRGQWARVLIKLRNQEVLGVSERELKKGVLNSSARYLSLRLQS